jgi:hypothetical protein
MTRDELDLQIAKFLDNGGEVTRLRYSDEKMNNKARRIMNHRDRASNGSEQSIEFMERERTREKGMIFSRSDRMKK